jgi:lycopene beta-cyclase
MVQEGQLGPGADQPVWQLLRHLLGTRTTGDDHPLHAMPPQPKFRFYDSVLLNILHNRSLRGADIFRDLFQRNRAARVLKFLDNETSIGEDIGIITSLPTLPFAKAALSHLLH